MSRSPTSKQGEGSQQRGQREQTLHSSRAQHHSLGGWDLFPPLALFLPEPLLLVRVSTMAPAYRHSDSSVTLPFQPHHLSDPVSCLEKGGVWGRRENSFPAKFPGS